MQQNPQRTRYSFTSTLWIHEKHSVIVASCFDDIESAPYHLPFPLQQSWNKDRSSISLKSQVRHDQSRLDHNILIEINLTAAIIPTLTNITHLTKSDPLTAAAT